MEFKHYSVLKTETIDGLKVKKGGIYVDCTTGGAGHSLEIVKLGGKLIAIDKDNDALTVAREKLKGYDVTFVHDDFHNFKDILKNLNIEKVDGILLDLGVSSYQIDNVERGFTYMDDAPLDMRMNREQAFSAYNLVNEYSVEELSKIFFEYGEEPFARKIAQAICVAREKQPIKTTFELISVIESVLPMKVKFKQGHSSKKVFQAIRIEVNDELKDLKEVIMDMGKHLTKGGRLCVITFHSLEDRIAKLSMVELVGGCTCPKELPICVCGYVPEFKIISRKPIVASEKELAENNRSHSAKLRIIEKI